MRNLFAAFAAILFVAAPAAAEDAAETLKPLTETQVKNFVASLEGADKLGKELEADGKIEAMNAKTQPKAGEEFKPYSKAVSVLKKDYPADHARLAALVGPHGFSPEEWAAVGDRVMIAYMAEKMEQENPGALAQARAMDPAMLDMMPAHAKAQFESVLVMIAAVENAPANDREAIKPVMDDLDKAMDAETQ